MSYSFDIFHVIYIQIFINILQVQENLSLLSETRDNILTVLGQ
jgi:hypothetical protein